VRSLYHREPRCEQASSGAGIHDTQPDAPSIGLRSGSVLATPPQHQQPIHMPPMSREEDGGSFHFHSGLGLRGGKSIGRRSRTEAVNRLVLISVLTAGSAISLVALGCILAHRYPRASGGEVEGAARRRPGLELGHGWADLCLAVGRRRCCAERA
jgi:hypothetical protein